MNVSTLDKVELVLVGIALVLAAAIVLSLVTGCTPTPTPGPNYEATIAAVQADKAACGETLYQTMGALNDCLTRPTQTPHVIVVTPIPPTPVPITPTPPYPSNLVKCDEAPLGTRMYVTARTTVRFWHSEASNNLGQAEAGESGILIDKSKDDNAMWWWRAEGLVTNDHPYGTKGWVKAIYSGCVPPK